MDEAYRYMKNALVIRVEQVKDTWRDDGSTVSTVYVYDGFTGEKHAVSWRDSLDDFDSHKRLRAEREVAEFILRLRDLVYAQLDATREGAKENK